MRRYDPDLEEGTMLVGVETASRLLGVHHATVWRWIRAGRIPTVRLGHRVLIRRSVLEALIAEGEAR